MNILLLDDLSNEVVDRISFVLTKDGEDSMEIKGFALGEFDFNISPNQNSDGSIATLQQNIALVDSDHGGTAGVEQIAVPLDTEGKLLAFAVANDWNLLKFASKGNKFEVLNGVAVLDSYTFTDNEDGTYDVEVALDGEDYSNGQLLFTDAVGNKSTILIPSSAAAVEGATFPELTGDADTWTMEILIVSDAGNYHHSLVSSLTVTTVS